MGLRWCLFVGLALLLVGGTAGAGEDAEDPADVADDSADFEDNVASLDSTGQAAMVSSDLVLPTSTSELGGSGALNRNAHRGRRRRRRRRRANAAAGALTATQNLVTAATGSSSTASRSTSTSKKTFNYPSKTVKLSATSKKTFNYPSKTVKLSACKKHGSDGQLTLRPYKVEVDCTADVYSKATKFEISLGSGSNADPNEWADVLLAGKCLKAAKAEMEPWIAEAGTNVMKRSDELCFPSSELGAAKGARHLVAGRKKRKKQQGGSRKLLGSGMGRVDVTEATNQLFDGITIGTAGFGSKPDGYLSCDMETGRNCPKYRANERKFSCLTKFGTDNKATVECNCSPVNGKC
jgi:hypothetical protein